MMPVEAEQFKSKGERTRERLLTTAIDLFVAKGYEATTMRDIAAAADCSLGLSYRYFAGKEELVLALYARLADDLTARAADLPPGPLADRFDWFMRTKLALLQPYRAVFGAIAGAALSPGSEVAVLGERAAAIRRRVMAVMARLVGEAGNAPRGAQVEHVTLILYAAHLLLLLFWLNDRSPDGRATADLLTFTRSTLALLRPLLGLPPVAALLARLARALGPVFAPTA
jgi:AcrR family transcriptional regulator